MAGDIFLGALGLWVILAVATARAASQTGYSFGEFFLYALVALPVVVIVVALAAETETRRREAVSSGTDVEKSSCRGGEMLPRTVGLFALRAGTAATVAAVTALIATSPERTLTATEHTVIAIEHLAHRGVQFDKCVSEEAFADCQSIDDIAVSAAAALDAALKQGGGLAWGGVRPVFFEVLDGLSTAGAATATHSVAPERVTAGSRDAAASRSNPTETSGDVPAGTERRATVEKAVPVAYRGGTRDTRRRDTQYNVEIVRTGGAPLRLVRD